MRYLTDSLRRLASTRMFRPNGLGLLILLSVGVALQAQSGVGGTAYRPVDFNPDARLGLAATDLSGTTTAHSGTLRVPGVALISACPATPHCAGWFVSSPSSHAVVQHLKLGTNGDKSEEASNPPVQNPKAADFDQRVYYKNKLEFSLDGGWLPINIPFVFDVFLGDAYTTTSLKYTLVPIISSLRWQVNDVDGPWIFRGNWDLQCSGTVTVVPRGPETHYFAWLLGVRRNFVPRHGRIAPYFDGRVGLGRIDAKGPLGVLYAQGQDFTFTVNLGSGVRYNINPRYSFSAGLNWMHISNLYLSEPKFSNYGINVYGPMFGINVRLGQPPRHSN